MSRDSSTATLCSSLNFLVSLSQRTEPAPPLRIASSGFAPGKSPPATWVSWPTFSSSVICARSASTRALHLRGPGSDPAPAAPRRSPNTAPHENAIANAVRPWVPHGPPASVRLACY